MAQGVKKRIPVLFGVESFSGGVLRHVVDLALALDPEEFEVHLITSSLRTDQEASDSIKLLEQHGIRVVLLPIRTGPPSRVIACRSFGLPGISAVTGSPSFMPTVPKRDCCSGWPRGGAVPGRSIPRIVIIFMPGPGCAAGSFCRRNDSWHERRMR